MKKAKQSATAKKARARHKAIQGARAKNKILKAGARPKLKITKREMRKILADTVDILPRNAMLGGDFGPPVSFAAVQKALAGHKGPIAGRIHFGVTSSGEIIINPTVHDFAVHTGRRMPLPDDAA